MKDILHALKGARLIAEMEDGSVRIRHYLLPDGMVLEVLARRR